MIINRDFLYIYEANQVPSLKMFFNQQRIWHRKVSVVKATDRRRMYVTII